MDDNEGTNGSGDATLRDAFMNDVVDLYVVYDAETRRFRIAVEPAAMPSSTILEVTPGFIAGVDDPITYIDDQIDRIVNGRTWRYADPDKLRDIAKDLQDPRDDWAKAFELFAMAAHESNKRKGVA